jgi:SAM-dependent methyltransferase
MHVESMQMMSEALGGLEFQSARALDVGSLDINGTYRGLIEGRGWEYVGLDIVPGKNVDVVTTEPYNYPFEDEEFDVVISGSTMEHVRAPWLWMVELYRVLRAGGFLAICTVMAWGVHRHPVDCWRILPDGMEYLLGSAGFKDHDIRTMGDTILGLAWK